MSIKSQFRQEEIIILNVYKANNTLSKYVRQNDKTLMRNSPFHY